MLIVTSTLVRILLSVLRMMLLTVDVCFGPPASQIVVVGLESQVIDLGPVLIP